MVKPSRRRPLVDYLRDQYRASERHACRVLRLVRGTYRYKSHQKERTELRRKAVKHREEQFLAKGLNEGWSID